MWQRFQTHFSRNLLNKVSLRQRPVIHGLLRELYISPDYVETYRRRDKLLTQLESVAPKSAELLDEVFADITAVLLGRKTPLSESERHARSL